MWILIVYVLIAAVGEAVVIVDLGSNLPLGQFADFVVVILRCARVWMAAGSAFDQA